MAEMGLTLPGVVVGNSVAGLAPMLCGVTVVPCEGRVVALVGFNGRWPVVYYRGGEASSWVGPINVSCPELPNTTAHAVTHASYCCNTRALLVGLAASTGGTQHTPVLSVKLPGRRYFPSGGHDVCVWSFWAAVSFYVNLGSGAVPVDTVVREFDNAEQCTIGFFNAQRRLNAVGDALAAKEQEDDPLLSFLLDASSP